MQRAAALDVMDEDRRDVVGTRREEDGGARGPASTASARSRAWPPQGSGIGWISLHERGPATAPDQHAGDQAPHR